MSWLPHPHIDSFKVRGAFNRILSAAETGELTDAGVVATSGGNATLAIAYAAIELAYRPRRSCAIRA